jgi:hypothetical protein
MKHERSNPEINNDNLPVLEIPILNKISITNLIQENSLSSYNLKRISIGNDNSVYFLFAQSIPEKEARGHGLFEPTISNTQYCAVSLSINWENCQVFPSKLMNFGKIEQNIHYIQPTSNCFLLVGSRCHYHEN